MTEGWISIHRKIEHNWVWEDKPFSFGQAWIDLILLANHKDNKELKDGKLQTYKAGTVNRSILWLSNRWGWERRKTTRFLKLLESDKMVSVDSTRHGTTITLINYEVYRYQGTTDGTTDSTSDGQPMHNRRYINNNDNNENNENKKDIKAKPIRHKYGLYKNVLLSDEDIEKLKREFPKDYLSRIDRVSEYCKSKGKSYNDYLATIRSWARKENKDNGFTTRDYRADEERRNRELDEIIRRVESGEADHDDDGLWD